MALISKGIELYFKEGQAGPDFSANPTTHDEYGWLIPGLQEIGEISTFGGGNTRDKIEITTLADDKHVYTEGLLAESDMSGITFKFLFDADVYAWFGALAKNIETLVGSGQARETVAGTWYVKLPDKTVFTMKATITDAKLDGAGTNSALTMTLTLTPFKAITVAAGA